MPGLAIVIAIIILLGFIVLILGWLYKESHYTAEAIYWVEERKRLEWVKVYGAKKREDCARMMSNFEDINPDLEYRIVYE